jgi:hypothetical protein
MIQADDLAAEERAVNLPGTDTERPNWRRRLRLATEDCFDAGRPVLEAVRAARGSSTASAGASLDQQRAPQPALASTGRRAVPPTKICLRHRLTCISSSGRGGHAARRALRIGREALHLASDSANPLKLCRFF